MAEQAQEGEVFLWSVINDDRHGEVTPETANEFLKSFRGRATGPAGHGGILSVTEEAKDLTNRAEFNWFGYLRCHPEGQEIVGRGVTKFELRFLAPIDHNVKQRRLDFIVHRVAEEEFPHVRLHPSKFPIMRRGRDSRKEALPVYGFLEEWTGKSIPGIFDGQGFTQGSAEHAVPRHDIIGRNEAWAFLDKMNNECGDRVFLELTDGQVFPWHRYVRSHEQFKVHASQQAAAGPKDSWAPGRGGTKLGGWAQALLSQARSEASVLAAA
jgi:hypothetical protein